MDGRHLKNKIFLTINILMINIVLSIRVTAVIKDITLKGFYDFLYEQKYIMWIPIVLIIILVVILVLIKIKKKYTKKEKVYYMQEEEEEKETEIKNITDKPTSTSFDEDFNNLRKHIDELLKNKKKRD